MDILLTGIHAAAVSLTTAIRKAKLLVQNGDPTAAEGSDVHSFYKLPTNSLLTRLSPSYILVVGFTLGYEKWPNYDSFVYVAKS